MTSKANKAIKTGKGSKSKDTSGQVPTEVHTPASQPSSERIKRAGGESRSIQERNLESKFKYRAPEPIFEGNYWEEINLNPGDNYQTPGNKYIGIANRLDRET